MGGGIGQGAANWWEAGGASGCVAAYQPKGAASLADSYINLANPGTYDAALGVAPTWNTATGWTFDGSTQYLTTGITANANWSMILRFANVSGTGGGGAGTDVAPRFFLQPNLADKVYYASADFVAFAPGLATGVIAVAGVNCYRNAALDGVVTGLSGAAGGAIELGRIQGIATRWLNGDIIACAIYSNDISAQIVALTDAINAV